MCVHIYIYMYIWLWLVWQRTFFANNWCGARCEAAWSARSSATRSPRRYTCIYVCVYIYIYIYIYMYMYTHAGCLYADLTIFSPTVTSTQFLSLRKALTFHPSGKVFLKSQGFSEITRSPSRSRSRTLKVCLEFA